MQNTNSQNFTRLISKKRIVFAYTSNQGITTSTCLRSHINLLLVTLRLLPRFCWYNLAGNYWLVVQRYSVRKKLLWGRFKLSYKYAWTRFRTSKRSFHSGMGKWHGLGWISGDLNNFNSHATISIDSSILSPSDYSWALVFSRSLNPLLCNGIIPAYEDFLDKKSH